MASSGVRHGQSAMVQQKMVEFGSDGTAVSWGSVFGTCTQRTSNLLNMCATAAQVWDFKAKALLKGETDGSSYPNGGMRATHTAGGYLVR